MNTDERDRSLLETRARLLSRPRQDGLHMRAATPFALFERAGMRYAIHPRFVFEVSRVLAPTPLPLAAPHWLGISSLHGELLAIVDLAVLLGHDTGPDAVEVDPDLADRRSSLVLVMGTERREFGLRVDTVLEARPLPQELAKTPAGDSSSHLISGTTDEGVRVLRGEVLLSDPRLYIEANLPSEA